VKTLAALRALGPGSEPEAQVKERVYGALLASLEGAAAVGAAGAAAAALSKAPLPASVAPATAPLLAGIASTKALLIGAAIWLIGGATGAALFGAFHRQEVRVVYVDRPVLSSKAVVAERAPESPILEALPSAPVVSSATSTAATKSPISTLAQERALLDTARADAARGEPAFALEQVARHARQFPQGRLSEEREALAVRALLALGRKGEARARAEAFRGAYPRSFLMPVIDSALSAP
jgi:hypothetical protein